MLFGIDFFGEFNSITLFGVPGKCLYTYILRTVTWYGYALRCAQCTMQQLPSLFFVGIFTQQNIINNDREMNYESE